MSVVNYETGGIIAPGTDLAPIDRTAVSVVTTLENAKRWLSTAVEMTGPEEIAAAKAHIRTAETYARELHLSKDIQLDAQEMVRRAEYALGRSIRKGQAEGTIRRRGQRLTPGNQHTPSADPVNNQTSKPGPYDFASPDDLTGNNAGIYDLTDGVERDDFDAALSEAKAEGNLSRANVVRKVKAKKQPDRSRDAKADVIADLASQGYTSRQMAPQVGVSDSRVRDIAREFGIDIPADRMVGKTRRIDHTAAVESAVTELDNWANSLTFIDFAEVDMSERDEWVASLTNSLTELRRFIKQIKETTHV